MNAEEMQYRGFLLHSAPHDRGWQVQIVPDPAAAPTRASRRASNKGAITMVFAREVEAVDHAKRYVDRVVDGGKVRQWFRRVSPFGSKADSGT